MTRRPAALRSSCVILAVLAGLVAGCLPVTATDYDRLFSLRQSRQTAVLGIETAVDAGAVKDAGTAQLLKDLITESALTLDNAEAKLNADDKLGAAFVLDEANRIVGRLIQAALRYKLAPPPEVP